MPQGDNDPLLIIMMRRDLVKCVISNYRIWPNLNRSYKKCFCQEYGWSIKKGDFFVLIYKNVMVIKNLKKHLVHSIKIVLNL